MARTIFFEDFTGFGGLGFAPTPGSGQLDSDFWSISGTSADPSVFMGPVAFGVAENSGDFARGTTTGGVSTGGVYALDQDGDTALMVQPTGSDFTQGAITLRVVNTEDVALSDVTVSYELLINNDQPRANSVDFQFDRSNTTAPFISVFTPTLVTSAEAADENGFVSTTFETTIPDFTWEPGQELYFRWFLDDFSGGGARDEFAIDDVEVVGEAPGDGGDDGVAAGAFTLELLHLTDQEPLNLGGTFSDVINASAVMNALEAQDLGGDGVADNTLRLSSGDAIIPGLFYGASETVFGTAGVGDILIQNELGFQAIALGNHEFDFGTGVLAGLVSGDVAFAVSPEARAIFDAAGVTVESFDGTAFPYLSGNLGFAADANLAPLAVADGQAPAPNAVTGSTVLDVNGEKIGVVGATTPTLGRISSPGGVAISPAPFDVNPTPEQLDALAAEIQADVDALLDANPGMNKVVLLAHMQRFDIERALAERLSDVDIIVAGGSNTRLFDGDDRIRDGDTNQGTYPTFVENAGGSMTALVNTDGSYKYVGRLVIDFDESGEIIPESYDPEVSGAYATDAQGVADLGAEGLIDPEIKAIVEAIEAAVVAQEGNVFGVSEVFLNGNRSGEPIDGVRTQETNLGNLTADANLAIANEIAAANGEANPVVFSLKNGGGIRASIGETVVQAGETEPTRIPNQALTNGDGAIVKPAGGISQNDIATTLAFNNGLTLLTLTGAEIVALLEHGVSTLPGVAGSFPQISGATFSFDPALPAGDRLVNAALRDAEGTLLAELMRNGALVNPEAEYRVVTLSFLAAPRFDNAGNFIGGGDGYPFPNTNTDPNGTDTDGNPITLETGDPDLIARVNVAQLAEGEDDPRDGDATFAPDGSEQDALAEYLLDTFFPENGGEAYAEADTPPELDERIQNLAFREDTVFSGDPSPRAAELLLSEIAVTPTAGEFIEIHNPGDAAVDLSDIYVTDATFAPGGQFYYNLVTGANFGGGGFGDFLARFPEAATIDAGAYLTIALSGSADFVSAYGFAPDFELFDDGSDDGEAAMREAAPGSINGQGGLSNGGEFVALFEWDGESDRVRDHDYVVWGDKAEAVDKTGVSVDGPDADAVASAYLTETAVADQDVVDTGSHDFGNSFQRIDLTEGDEAQTGSNGVNGADETSENLSATWTSGAAATPGEAAPDVGGADGITLISAIQGDGEASPLLGQVVTVEAVVVGDHQDDVGDQGDLNGFFLQEEDADHDADTRTSEGLFVFEGSDPAIDLRVGDVVRITGTVDEFFGKTQIDTVTAIEIVERDRLGLVTPAAITVGPDVAGYEAVEGMLVTVASGTDDPLTVTANFNLDRFGEVQISAGNKIQPTQLFDAQTQAAAVAALAAANDNNTLFLDDGFGFQNPDQFAYIPNNSAGDDGDGILGAGDDFAQGGTLRLGAEIVEPITGVMDFGFGEYRVLPNAPLVVEESTNGGAREAAPADVGGDLRVASVNVLNYFATLDVSGAGVGPDNLDPRGADNADELARQTAKLVEQLGIIDGEVFALQELGNDGFGAEGSIATLAAALSLGTGRGYAFVDPTDTDTDFVGTDAITTGIIYDTDAVALLYADFLEFEEASAATTFALADALNPFASSDDQVGDFARNRPIVAATFEDKATGAVFTVASVHFKSKGDSNLEDVVRDALDPSEGDGVAPQVAIDALLADPNHDQGDGQGFWNQVRLDAAIEARAWLTGAYADAVEAEFGAGAADNVLLMGDFNAYAQEDPTQAIRDDAGFVDIIDDFVPGGQDEAYSFVFDGQRGTLDQAFASTAIAEAITGATEWHVNADEPDLLNYDTSFKNPGFFAPDQYAASDHDPLIVGLAFEPATEPPIVITGTGTRDRFEGTEADEVFVFGAFRSERADGGGGDDVFVFDPETFADGQRGVAQIEDWQESYALDIGGAEITSVRETSRAVFLTVGEDDDRIIVRGIDDFDSIRFVDDTAFV